MAENNLSEAIRNIVVKLEDTIQVACDQLRGELPVQDVQNFNSDLFWTNFVAATKLLSHEATKLCMAFNDRGMSSAEECQALVDNVENACLAFLSVFFKLPKSRGKNFHKVITEYVLDVLDGMKQLCLTIRSQNGGQLRRVGDVWESCEQVENLPKDNRDAIIELCQTQYYLVHDACQELMTAIDDESEIEVAFPTPPNGIQIPPVQVWSDSDRNILYPCSGLLKAAKACIKKTQNAITERGNGSDENCINELDLIAEIVRSSSSLADDFVMSIYPPMDHSLVCQQAAFLKDNSKDLMANVRSSHFCSATDEVWLDFLTKAIDHNWVRINDMVLAD